MSSAYFVKSGGVGERRSQRTHQKCSHALFIISQQKKTKKRPHSLAGLTVIVCHKISNTKEKNIKPHAIITHAQNSQLRAFFQ